MDNKISIVSIHASTWEATAASRVVYRLEAWFQSTPPRGRRPAAERAANRLARVSIHASTWEATILD